MVIKLVALIAWQSDDSYFLYAYMLPNMSTLAILLGLVNNKEIKFIMILWDTPNSITSYAKYICYLNSTTFGYLVLFVEPYLLCEEIWNLKYTSQRQCEYIFLQVGCSAFKCLTIVFFDSHFLMDLVTKL